MPDWREYVREHLGANWWRKDEESEVVAELAGHLEEHYDGLRAQGISEAEAVRRSKRMAGNWEELREGIWMAKREDRMSDRIRQLWVPGLVTLLLANVALAVMQRLQVEPVLVGVGTYWTLCLYVPWLLVLPVVGALGGYLARRALGCGWHVYLAAGFPALVIGGLFLVILPFALVFDRNVSSPIQLSGVLAGLTSWVVLPGMALAGGVALEGLRPMKRVNG
jgi:hypothetical protein